MSRPRLSTIDQEPLLGTPQEVVLANEFIDGCWHDCQACIDQAIGAVASRPGTFMVLRRAYRLQETGQLVWAHGTADGDAETAKLAQVGFETLRQLSLAAGRMWVARARLFDEIDSIGARTGRVLERSHNNRIGRHHRDR